MSPLVVDDMTYRSVALIAVIELMCQNVSLYLDQKEILYTDHCVLFLHRSHSSCELDSSLVP